MTDETVRQQSLVLYKTRPAVVTAVSKKLTIATADGPLSVRPKDVTLLHPGPLAGLGQLAPLQGEVKTAWELLAGGTTTLPELAELAYGDFTPRTAWAAWQHVADGLYFSGEPDAIAAHTAAQVAAEQAARVAKAAEQAAWEAFLARVADGRYEADDAVYLNEVAALAMGQQARSKVLRALNESETPEQAHAFLLKIGYWDEMVNPHPARLGMPTADPEVPLPPLPDEPRRDLTHLAAFAIDDEGNQDPDDAISVGEDGRFWVHVADVAALVPPDSAADLEARARGANLYLPEGTVHMLPPAATRALALGLDDVSPALSFALRLDEAGEVTLEELTPSLVRVTRLTYAEADARLDDGPLAVLHATSRRFTARRRANGAVDLVLPEVRVRVEAGEVTIRPLPPLRSRDVVRDFMLMAGEAVARFALQQQIPLAFTVQDPPLPAEALPEGLAGEFARRRLMQRSQPSSAPGAHAGLGLPLYVQCTSPLRRYLDLVAHQQLRAFLRGEPLLDGQALMARVGAADAAGGGVRQAERRANAHWTMVYLRRRPDWRDEGVVVEQRGRQTTVLLPALAWDARLHLRGDRPLNSQVTLQVTDVNLPLAEARFAADKSG